MFELHKKLRQALCVRRLRHLPGEPPAPPPPPPPSVTA